MTSSLFLPHSCLFLTFFPSRYFSSWFPPFCGPSWCSLSNCDSLKIVPIFRLSQSVSYQTPNYDQLNKGPLPSQNNSASGARHYPQANISWISCSQTISFMLILAQTCGETPGEALSSNGFYREIRFNQILNRKKLSSVRCSSLCFSTVVTRVQSFGSKQLFFLCCVSVSSLKTSNRANPITSATETHWGQGLYQIRVIKPCPELLLQSNTC